MKQTLYILLFIIALPVQMMAQVVINEVVYANRNVITDADGDTPDYIELYNSGNETVNLKDFQLIDDTTKSNYWLLPDVSIAAKGYLLIFASDKNLGGANEMHASFKLKVLQDAVYLLNPEGEVLNQSPVRCVPGDKCLGRWPDGSSNWQVLSPTPSTTNDSATVHDINFVSDSIWIDKSSGYYKSDIAVNLFNTNANNAIYYTLDGDIPDEDDEVFDEAIELSDLTPNKNRFADKTDEVEYSPGNKIFKGNILRAVVYSDGCPASDVLTETYFINENMKNRYKVPVISLVTEKDNLFDEEIGIYTAGKYTNFDKRGKDWEREIHVEIFDSTGNTIIDQDAGLRIHGRGSRWASNKSMRIYARDEYGKANFDYPFFDQRPHLNSYKTLLIRATNDWPGTLFLDEMCQELVDDMNMYYSASETAILFINGEYWGIYCLRERQDEHYMNANLGYPFDDYTVISYDMHKGILAESGEMSDYDDLVTWIETNDPQSDLFYDELSEKIDLENMMDFFIAELYFGNTDFPYNNLRLWKESTDTAKWKFLFFDLDAAMTRIEFDILTEYNNDYDHLQRYPDWSVNIFKNVLLNDRFRREFYQRFYHHMQNTFDAQTVMQTIDKYATMYTPLVDEHNYRWGLPGDKLEWNQNINQLKAFAMQRPLAINKQLRSNFSLPFDVYPNPSNGTINIEFPNNDATVEIQLIDLNGRTVLETGLSGTYFRLENLPKGIYILKVHMYNQYFVQKIVITN